MITTIIRLYKDTLCLRDTKLKDYKNAQNLKEAHKIIFK